MSAADRNATLEALDVSRETSARLDAYIMLLEKWNPAINLVSRASLPGLWRRHVLDSAQLWDLAPQHAILWADLGAGGGFPGLVISILAAERRPQLRMTLVESDRRKAAFLAGVIRETGISADVLDARIEDLPPLGADVVSARALAPLDVLLGHAERHLASGGTALFPKGAGYQAELDEALERWRFSVQKHSSRTDPESVVLSLGDIARA
jgi:16S rRNA (guanine527-N7)-methyltransferase